MGDGTSCESMLHPGATLRLVLIYGDESTVEDWADRIRELCRSSQLL